jgi:hypothetical protein
MGTQMIQPKAIPEAIINSRQRIMESGDARRI